MTADKHIESQSSPAPANERAPAAEDSAIKQFSMTCHSEPQQIFSEASKIADQTKAPPEKLFLERIGEIAQNADKSNTLKADVQAKVAWQKLFHPECFNEKSDPTKEASLNLRDNIYG